MLPLLPVEAEYRSYFPVTEGLKPTIRKIITQFEFGCAFANLDRDIRLLVKAFIKQAPETHVQSYQMRFDILQAPFYRGQAAYIVGRVVSQTGTQPFVIAVLHDGNKGLYIDALLTRSRKCGSFLALPVLILWCKLMLLRRWYTFLIS